MKRHQVSILTAEPGRTWASCSTCGRKSKQGTRAAAETWMARHVDDNSQSKSRS